jgi:translation initiation factor IF-1
MPGVTARSASKNMSRGKRASAAKNSRRVEAALGEVLESCTYGKIHKALGNKMFIVINTKKQERLGYIRGKMARINVGDCVLLNIRDYESRTGKDNEIYDIMAVFSSKDVSKMIKMDAMPSWMSNNSRDLSEDDEYYFDYSDKEDDEEEVVKSKKDKKSHRPATIQEDDGVASDESDINIDDI